MWDILPGTLYHWYRDHISDYLPDQSSGKWPSQSLMEVDRETGEVLKEQPVYVLKPENIGEKMCIDDKMLCHDELTILSNAQTCKIAMMIESCKEQELVDAFSFFGDAISEVQVDELSDEVHVDLQYDLPYIEVKGHRYQIYDHRPSRRWRHLDLWQYKTFLTTRLPRFKDEKGFYHTIEVPWAEESDQMTVLLKKNN